MCPFSGKRVESVLKTMGSKGSYFLVFPQRSGTNGGTLRCEPSVLCSLEVLPIAGQDGNVRVGSKLKEEIVRRFGRDDDVFVAVDRHELAVVALDVEGAVVTDDMEDIVLRPVALEDSRTSFHPHESIAAS